MQQRVGALPCPCAGAVLYRPKRGGGGDGAAAEERAPLDLRALLFEAESASARRCWEAALRDRCW